MNTVDNRAAWTNTLCYLAAFVGLGLVMAVLGPTLPALAEHTGTTLRDISPLFLARGRSGSAASFSAIS
ncbi:MAG: hypothetical protein ACE5G0_20435 [Rhodothermales bacterium]